MIGDEQFSLFARACYRGAGWETQRIGGRPLLWLSGHTSIRFTCHGSGAPTAIDDISSQGV
jgi:hypothetical protein